MFEVPIFSSLRTCWIACTHDRIATHLQLLWLWSDVTWSDVHMCCMVHVLLLWSVCSTSVTSKDWPNTFMYSGSGHWQICK